MTSLSGSEVNRVRHVMDGVTFMAVVVVRSGGWVRVSRELGRASMTSSAEMHGRLGGVTAARARGKEASGSRRSAGTRRENKDARTDTRRSGSESESGALPREHDRRGSAASAPHRPSPGFEATIADYADVRQR